ncbi:PfkB family carbohydrate kinase [Massilia sp. DWR3-1-1]|uniref:PfkB family carbohydrate kinase n=1 Tax=Massilia sp. DWR3-1-1 TaxID=2804559 RepID=UPI003CED54D1
MISPSSMSAPLPSPRAADIVLFGEALIDEFPATRVVGGAPFNVARHLAAFQAGVLMVSRIGDDANGALVRAEYARFAMRKEGLQRDPVAPTGRVLVEADGDSHRFVILPDQAYDHIDGALALAALACCAPSTIYFGTMVQRGACARAALAGLLAATPARRFLDLNVRDGQTSADCVFASLREADVVKVNEDELAALFGWVAPAAPPLLRGGRVDMDDGALRVACLGLMQRFDVSRLIVTLGPRGAVCLDADGQYVVAAASTAPLHMVDTVGAGDAFAAVCLLGCVRGWALATTLRRANEFASAICGLAGAVPADLAFYVPWRARWLAD